MITLNLEYREVLWWMQGGMAGSHLRWNVYEDMVNKVWPQCSEQERRNMWFIMRRDLGTYWRPDGWSGFDLKTAHGEGEWLPTEPDMSDFRDTKTIDCEGEYPKRGWRWITDKTPWEYFRKVLARFDPENQFAVTLPIKDEDSLLMSVNGLSGDSIIDAPTRYVAHQGRHIAERFDIESHPYLTVRAYKWKDLEGRDAYFIDWSRRCDPDRITRVEPISIPDDGTM